MGLAGNGEHLGGDAAVVNQPRREQVRLQAGAALGKVGDVDDEEGRDALVLRDVIYRGQILQRVVVAELSAVRIELGSCLHGLDHFHLGGDVVCVAVERHAALDHLQR